MALGEVKELSARLASEEAERQRSSEGLATAHGRMEELGARLASEEAERQRRSEELAEAHAKLEALSARAASEAAERNRAVPHAGAHARMCTRAHGHEHQDRTRS